MNAATCLLLEDLVQAVVGKPYHSVEDLVRKRIELTLLKSPTGKFSREQRQILAVGYYTGIQEYATVQPRKIDGAPYFRHVDEAYQQLLLADVNDHITHLVDIFHDAIEEKVETEKKRRESSRESLSAAEEAALIVRYTEDLAETLTRNFHDFVYQDTRLAKETAGAIVRPTRLLSRGSNELYYKSIEHPFTDPQILAEELGMPITELDCIRAIIGKYGDRIANMNDMDSRKEKPLDTEVARFLFPERIYKAFEHDNRDIIEILNDAAAIAAEQHPVRTKDEFTGSQRLYQCFKSVVLTNRYRRRKVEEGKPIPEVSNLLLSRATQEQARVVMDHVCRYHCNADNFNTRIVYEIIKEHREYAKAGGYNVVTHASTGSYMRGFDGIFEGLFDARVQGDRSALKYIDEDRSVMFRVAVALHHIASKYHKKSNWYIHGISAQGLDARPAVGR